MNKQVKTTMLIIMGLLALVTVTGIIYGMQNRINAEKLYGEYDESILSTVDEAVNTCQQAYMSVGATPEESEGLTMYVKNIAEAESPVLKAYIAQTMISYTGDFLTVKDVAMHTDHTSTQKRLIELDAQLENVKNFKRK